MKAALVIAAFGEIATGLALLAAPSPVGRLLLGADPTGVAVPVSRVLGIALLALGVACWRPASQRAGMFTYSVGVALYLGYLGLSGGFRGILLWPVVALHGLLALLLTGDFSIRKPNRKQP